ncbi:YbdD/YjiX family protein [Streptomyces sp. NPDC051907]|uniref:YbdD/YjiX family protein n=1 Tax=Streptomyces sp. NPDC051907 TaxID=3155284 RepID=UPI003426EDBA
MRLRQVLSGLRWYVREFTGEAAYDRYCERHRGSNPHAPVPTRRQYERLRVQHQEDHPSSRCC